jgi:membrane associated rhomboid family serine protease
MVFPLYDDNPLKLPVAPIATWGLIAINVFVFLFQTGSDTVSAEAFVASFGAIPAAITHYIPPMGSLPAEVTLVTSLFLHGGWEHLLGNMIYLFVFGDDIEQAMGRLRFLAFYVLVGIAAALAFVVLDPHSTTVLIGASGAISGILAAYLMLRPCAEVSVFVLRAVVRVRAYWVIGAWILLQIYQFAGEADDGVAYLAHIGGLIAGAVLFVTMRPAGVKLFICRGPAESDEPIADASAAYLKRGGEVPL